MNRVSQVSHIFIHSGFQYWSINYEFLYTAAIKIIIMRNLLETHYVIRASRNIQYAEMIARETALVLFGPTLIASEPEWSNYYISNVYASVLVAVDIVAVIFLLLLALFRVPFDVALRLLEESSTTIASILRRDVGNSASRIVESIVEMASK